MDPFFRRGQNNFDKLTSPESVSIPLNRNSYSTHPKEMTLCLKCQILLSGKQKTELNNLLSAKFSHRKCMRTYLRTCAPIIGTVSTESLLDAFWIDKDAKFLHADNDV